MSSPAATFASNIDAINRFKPDVILGFGSYIGAVFRHAWIKGIPIHRPKIIQYGGDAIQNPDRAIIDRLYCRNSTEYQEFCRSR